MKILSDWKDYLIWCPSQCSVEVEDRGIKYQIYLRWRHQDPWKAWLIRLDTNEWFDLDLPYFKADDSLDEIKKAVIGASKKYLNRHP